MVAAVRDLFGGAITVRLPVDCQDVSYMRQVPDTQEVFVASESDQSFVIEILERVEHEDSKKAAMFLFDSLAHDNEATSASISEINVPDASGGSASESASESLQPILLRGKQQVKKFNRMTSDEILILMAIYRIAAKSVDVVYSANIPLVAPNERRLTEAEIRGLEIQFHESAVSLRIVDYSLFA